MDCQEITITHQETKEVYHQGIFQPLNTNQTKWKHLLLKNIGTNEWEPAPRHNGHTPIWEQGMSLTGLKEVLIVIWSIPPDLGEAEPIEAHSRSIPKEELNLIAFSSKER